MTIGTATQPLETEVHHLAGRSSQGSVWVTNYGALTIGGVPGVGSSGVSAAGSVNVSAHSPLTLSGNISAAHGSITLTSGDGLDDGRSDDLTIGAGSALEAPEGAVSLFAGDNLLVAAGSIIRALGTVTLACDANPGVMDADPGVGGSLTLAGTITGPTSQQGKTSATALVLRGGADADTFDLVQTPTGTPLTVWMGGGNDVVHVEQVNDPVAVYRGAGDDHFFINPSHIDGVASSTAVVTASVARVYGGTLNQYLMDRYACLGGQLARGPQGAASAGAENDAGRAALGVGGEVALSGLFSTRANGGLTKLLYTAGGVEVSLTESFTDTGLIRVLIVRTPAARLTLIIETRAGEVMVTAILEDASGRRVLPDVTETALQSLLESLADLPGGPAELVMNFFRGLTPSR